MISVITVVYNSEEYIAKTIESVRAQGSVDLEHIIVDGHSTDGTLDVIRRYEGIRWISESDRGLYDAMNKGLRMARGNYVWFLNSGDEIYSPDTLKHLVEELPEDADVIYGGTMIVDESGKEIGDRRLKPPPGLTWRSFRQGMIVCHQSLIVRRSLAPEYCLDYQLAADIDWAIRSTKEAKVIHQASMVLSKFMEGGLSGQNIKQGLKERFRIMTRFYGFVPTLLRHFLFGIRLTNFYLKNRRI